MPGGLRWGLALALTFSGIPFAPGSDLLRESEVVAECDDWYAPSYEWLSNDRIFYLRVTATDYEGCLIQCGSPFERLAKGFNRKIEDKYVHYKLSPDRKWALIRHWEEGSPPSFRALTLDGTEEKSFPAEVGEPLDYTWLPNSTGFVVLEIADNLPFLTRYTLAGSKATRKERLALGEDDRSSQNATGPPARFLGFTPAGTALLASVPTRRGQAVEITEADIDGKQPPRSFQVEVAAIEFVAEVTLTQRGDRLAWLVQTVGPREARRTEVRASKRDGTEMVTLGGVERDVDAENPANIRWHPGGEYVSFIHHGKVYAADARLPHRPAQKPGASTN
jgi:hypothetical protein